MDVVQHSEALRPTSLTLCCTAPALLYGSLATFQDVTELVSAQQSRLVQLNWERLLSPSIPHKDPGSDLPWDSLQLCLVIYPSPSCAWYAIPAQTGRREGSADPLVRSGGPGKTIISDFPASQPP